MSQVLTVPDEVIDRNPPVTPPLDETEAARRYGRLLQASAGAARALGGLEERFTGETDWAAAPGRFRAEADAIGRDFADSFGDDRTGRTLFSRDFDSLANARAAAFAGTSEVREREALQTAYADRMAGLAQMARLSGGSQRAEVLRQVALEAHRAQAFGLESDPTTAVERFIADLQPLRADDPATESFGAPSQAPADRVEYERRAREGWALPASPEARKPERPTRSAAPSPSGDSLGFPSSELVQRDIDRYTTVQNTGEGDEARSFETIGRDYWASRKALDVDPGNEVAGKQVEAFSKELDRHAFWKAMDEVAGPAALQEMVKLDLPDKMIFRLIKRGISAYEVWEISNKYRDHLREADRIRSGIDVTKDPDATPSASDSTAP
jgi:hypothetical protein